LYVTYIGVGLPNDSGGWSIRSTWFRGATTPANVSTVKTVDGATQVMLLEGMTDWFSYVVLYGEPDYDVIVLNSLVYIPLLIDRLKKYNIVHGWLDSYDPANQKMSLMADEGVQLIDHRATFEGHNDFNDYLIYVRGQ